MAVVSEGRDQVAKLIGNGLTADQFGGVAIGSGTTAVSDTDTSLVTTVEAVDALTATVNGNTMTLVGTFTGNSATIRESSAYTNDTSSVMLARQIVSTINVESSDTLEITWDVNVSQ